MLDLAIREATSGEPGSQWHSNLHSPTIPPPTIPRYADAFVVFAVTVLSLAIGVWCLLRLGLALWMGTVAALAVYAVLLVGALAGAAIAGRGRRTRRADREPGDLWMQDPYAPDEPTQPIPESSGPMRRVRRTRRSRAGPRRRGLATRARPRSCRGPVPADPFDFRPKQEPSLPHAPSAAGLASLSARELKAAAPRLSGTAQPEMSVELVQDLIKKLADELNSTTAAERADKLLPASVTEAMIGHSVAALQATARTMPGPHADLRAAPSEGHQAPAAGGVPSWWPTAEPATGATPGAPRCPARRRRSIPSSRALPKPWRQSAWRCCSSRSMRWPKAGRAISR